MRRQKYYICSEISYSFLRQRHQIFAEYLSARYDVIFVERIPSRVPSDIFQRILRKFLQNSRKNHREISTPRQVTVVRALMLPEVNEIFKIYNKYRIRRVFRSAAQGDIIHLFANNPSIARFAEKNKIKLLFDIVHNWWEFPHHRRKQIMNLNYVLSKCQIVISDSDATLEKAKTSCLNGGFKNFHTIPPGVGHDWFPTEKHKMSLNVSNENIRVGFFGNLRANSDIELVRHFKDREDSKLEIFGRLDGSLSPIQRREFRSNYKGEFTVKDLLPQLRAVHALILPYDRSGFSSTIFPAKYFEALALGKPIFSNSNLYRLPKWNDFIWTTHDLHKLGWKKIFDQHYAARSEEQIAFAQENSWEVRVGKLLGVLDGNL